jgi:hypothetical protein
MSYKETVGLGGSFDVMFWESIVYVVGWFVVTFAHSIACHSSYKENVIDRCEDCYEEQGLEQETYLQILCLVLSN